MTLGAGQVVLHHLLALMSAHDHGGGLSTAYVLAGHAVATLLLTPVLCLADAAVDGLLGAVHRILPRRLRVAAVDVALPTRAIPAADVPLLASVGLVAAHARRGPPIAC